MQYVILAPDIAAELAVASFISEATSLELQRKNIFHRSQFISLIGFQDNVLYLEDAKRTSIIETYLRNNTLFCQNDSSFECIHVSFGLAFPEVNMRLKH